MRKEMFIQKTEERIMSSLRSSCGEEIRLPVGMTLSYIDDVMSWLKYIRSIVAPRKILLIGNELHID